MEENTLTIISLLCLVIGFFGSFLPVLPGTLLSWLGLVIFKYTSFADYGWPTLIVLGIIVLAFQAVNYVLPAYSSKKFGGSRYGVIGASIGLLVGIIFAPFGLVSIIIAPFLGAFIGEFLLNKSNTKASFKAAFGTFVGFMISTGIGMLLSLIFLVYVMWQLSTNAGWNWI
ncbi:DUF456 domain-containing protein [Weeksellaceae bacterium KMM 9713]|uniref:DUF456 domain-containing protein n=1 Tax=Profundicola chukchiensis TaxID=2961959 RepID=A0A9X4N2B4_9FLAO|nr:DUF456 domain-containing protein [Profundicola chukchiensis]MDG4945339.1 DUF456 domain-containing protein [Profundicola chukchiensis]MDG4950412.1 DUF456 domain-containing protein [Profundicola chukchiensis]